MMAITTSNSTSVKASLFFRPLIIINPFKKTVIPNPISLTIAVNGIRVNDLDLRDGVLAKQNRKAEALAICAPAHDC